MSGKKVLSQQERLDINKQYALSYCSVYKKHEVKDGKVFEWKFAENADYWSPYFGNCTIDLHKTPISVADSSTFEALAYSIEFPDFGMIDFDYWAAVDGCAWKSHMGGHRKDNGELMDFFSYSYIKTNEYGEITHWETHDNSDYDKFLDVAIGEHGPYKNGSDPYMEAVTRKLKSAGIDPRKHMH